MNDTTSSSARVAARAAGPAAWLSLLLLVAALLRESDQVALNKDPIAVASAAVGLVALILLAIGALALAFSHRELQRGPGMVAVLAAIGGTLLTAGGQWSMVFVLPGLTGAAPDVARDGLASVTAGYVISFLALGVGWGAVATVLLRSGAVSRASGVLLLVGSVLAIAPLPARFFLIATVVSLLCRGEREPVKSPLPQGAS